MTVSIKKGAKVSLTKRDPDLRRIRIGLGWDVNRQQGFGYDLDASIFLLGAGGRVSCDEHFVFYNNLRSPCGSVVHKGDNRTGAGEGDDEVIEVDFARLPAGVQRLVIGVTIHDAEHRRQHFGQITNAFIRLVNLETNVEVARFEFGASSAGEDAMLFGEVRREQGEWHFVAVGTGLHGGLAAMAELHGVDVA